MPGSKEPRISTSASRFDTSSQLSVKVRFMAGRPERAEIPAMASRYVLSCTALGCAGTITTVSERSAMRLKGKPLRANAARSGMAM
ncbi:hypothetical protein D3C73_1498080 [compost metagenome]